MKQKWVLFLFSQLVGEQPKGFAKIGLQQLLDCDKQLFIMAAHEMMGKLQAGVGDPKPLDTAISQLRSSATILQYLTFFPSKTHEFLAAANPRPRKSPRTDPGPKGGQWQFAVEAPAAGRVCQP